MDAPKFHQRQVVHNPAAPGAYSLQLAELGPHEKEHYGTDAVALVPSFRKTHESAFSWSNATPASTLQFEPNTLARTFTSGSESSESMPGLSPDLDTNHSSPEIGGPETPRRARRSEDDLEQEQEQEQEQEVSRFHAAQTNLQNPIGLSIEERPMDAGLLPPAEHSEPLRPRTGHANASFDFGLTAPAEDEPLQLARTRPKAVSRTQGLASASAVPPSGIPADWGADAPNRRDRNSSPGGSDEMNRSRDESNASRHHQGGDQGDDGHGDDGQDDDEQGDDEQDDNSRYGSRDQTPATHAGTVSSSSPDSDQYTAGTGSRNATPDIADFANLVGVAGNASAGGRRTRSSRLRIPQVVSHPLGSALSAASLRRGGSGVVPSAKPSLRSLRIGSEPAAQARIPRSIGGSRSGSDSSRGFSMQFGVIPRLPGEDRAQLEAQAQALARAQAQVEPLPWETEQQSGRERVLKLPQMFQPLPSAPGDAAGRSASEKVIWMRGDDLDDNPVRAGPAPWVSLPSAPLLINGQLCDAWGRKECSVEKAVVLLAMFSLFPPAWLLMGAGTLDGFVGVVPQYVKAVALALGAATLVAMVLCATLVSLL